MQLSGGRRHPQKITDTVPQELYLTECGHWHLREGVRGGRSLGKGAEGGSPRLCWVVADHQDA